ncbi:hypothetical protein HanXRQr2_Chr16g0754331 [Helianthus annuus]|uniref:Uncharacterized protein n=1 Tax=Helianthus annuus TaxID=4232 RepID=A0A9K3DUG0_HELAN|nr:hypothetical protein HanXRQr2_Chr16g0754331 [Helianthus annuus]
MSLIALPWDLRVLSISLLRVLVMAAARNSDEESDWSSDTLDRVKTLGRKKTKR